MLPRGKWVAGFLKYVRATHPVQKREVQSLFKYWFLIPQNAFLKDNFAARIGFQLTAMS